MSHTERLRDLLNAVGSAVERHDSAELKRSAAALENYLGDFGSEKAHKAARVLAIMGRVGDTINTAKVYQFLRAELGID